MEKRETFLVATVLVIACLFSISQTQGRTEQKLDNFNGINTSAPTASRSLTITSPIYTDSWEAGTTKNITWTGMVNANTNVSIFLFNHTSTRDSYTVIEQYVTGSYVAAGVGAYSWKIPSTQPPGDSYEIIIMYFNLASVNYGDVNYYYGASDPFTITASTSSNSSSPGFPVEITLLGLGIAIMGIVLILSKKHTVEA